MSSTPSTAISPALFYHPAFWCHSCDMSIGLPPSPTPTALLCPHCHRDSLEQMDFEDSLAPPSPASRNPFSMDPNNNATSLTLTPSDDNFLLNSPYLHRLIHHLTTTAADVENPRSAPASKASIDSLEEITITLDDDPTLLCPVCKDPFVVNSVAKLMPCKHTYHSECIIPWLEINNSCPVCRFKLPTCQENGALFREDVRFISREEFVDDEVDLYGFRNTLRHIVRRQGWSEEGNVGSGSEENLFSPTRVVAVERAYEGLWRENSVETVSSWPRWQVDEDGGGNGDGGASART